jgi:hypothetical protein
MPDVGDAGGAVSRDDIARLAPLFDRWFYALDPTSSDARSAKECFDREVQALYAKHVVDVYAGLLLSDFRAKVRCLCDRYLKKRYPRTPTRSSTEPPAC